MASAENQDLVDRLVQFYRDYYRDDVGELARNYPSEQRSLYVDWQDLFKFDQDIAHDYLSQPEQLREHAEEALQLYDLPVDVSLSQAHVRVHNLPERTEIRDIRSHHVARLLSVTGIVRKATSVRPKAVEAAFECQRCGTLSRIPQSGGDFQEPHECQGCERQGPFTINFGQSEFVDSQLLRIQESPEGLRGGQTPEDIDVAIEDDLTGRVSPGDHVTVTGILRLEQGSSGNENSNVFDVHMEGVAVEIEDAEFEELEIADADKRKIIERSSEADIYDQLVDSLAPKIYGFEEEKLGVMLQLFSGVTKHLPDGSRTRGDLHVLLVGDPGTGKSVILQYVRDIAPRSIYTSGKGSSAAGLTASAVRDEFGDGQQWSLEAGALVLADRGIAAVDELDKMSPSDRSAMHQALEQQEISVSKAGINATLKSRCSLLGAANPKHGRFDRYESIADQIDLEPALVSRFDLIFTVTDEVDAEEDQRLARHILQTNYAGELNTHHTEMDSPVVDQGQVDDATTDVTPELGSELLQKYIAYAKRNCFPMMTDDARATIEEFYKDLRAEGEGEDAPVPVTARKLEALVRLAEASARVRLSDHVEQEDAQRVIELVRSSLQDIGVDPETGEYDADVVETGTSKSQRDRIKTLKQTIAGLEDEYEHGAPKSAVLEAAEELGLDQEKAEHEITKLREQGELYEPEDDHYRTT